MYMYMYMTTVPAHPQRKLLHFFYLPSDDAGSQSSEDPADLGIERGGKNRGRGEGGKAG